MIALMLMPLTGPTTRPMACFVCGEAVTSHGGLLDHGTVPVRAVHADCLCLIEREEGLRNGERMQAYCRDMAADHDAREGRYHGD